MAKTSKTDPVTAPVEMPAPAAPRDVFHAVGGSYVVNADGTRTRVEYTRNPGDAPDSPPAEGP